MAILCGTCEGEDPEAQASAAVGSGGLRALPLSVTTGVDPCAVRVERSPEQAWPEKLLNSAAFHCLWIRGVFFNDKYDAPRRNRVDLIPWGHPKSKMENAAVFIICMICFCYCYVIRVPDMGSDDVCLIVALDVEILSWFPLLLYTNHAHIHRDYWHKDKSFKHHRCRCISDAMLLLYTDFMTAHTSRTHT